mmetsp:Transcript_118746/g.236539  ORF Transcript_118746/g.236539 Transcript_118746/m.236539 type:complete len:301 (+) Transcript_118746:1302-2204(+)
MVQGSVLTLQVFELRLWLIVQENGMTLGCSPSFISFKNQHLVLLLQLVDLLDIHLLCAEASLSAFPLQVVQLPVEFLVLVHEDSKLVFVPLIFSLLRLSQLGKVVVDLLFHVDRAHEHITSLEFLDPAVKLGNVGILCLVSLPNLCQLIGQLLAVFLISTLLQLLTGSLQHHVLLPKVGKLLIKLSARDLSHAHGICIDLTRRQTPEERIAAGLHALHWQQSCRRTKTTVFGRLKVRPLTVPSRIQFVRKVTPLELLYSISAHLQQAGAFWRYSRWAQHRRRPSRWRRRCSTRSVRQHWW